MGRRLTMVLDSRGQLPSTFLPLFVLLGKLRDHTRVLLHLLSALILLVQWQEKWREWKRERQRERGEEEGETSIQIYRRWLSCLGSWTCLPIYQGRSFTGIQEQFSPVAILAATMGWYGYQWDLIPVGLLASEGWQEAWQPSPKVTRSY